MVKAKAKTSLKKELPKAAAPKEAKPKKIEKFLKEKTYGGFRIFKTVSEEGLNVIFKTEEGCTYKLPKSEYQAL